MRIPKGEAVVVTSLGDGRYLECNHYRPANDEECLERVNLNTATEVELAGLAGMGPTRARMVVVARESRGGFKDVSELLGLRCIGSRTYARLVRQVYIGEEEREIERLRKENARLEEEARQRRWMDKIARAFEVICEELRSRFGYGVRLLKFEHVDGAGYWFSFELEQDKTRQTWCVRHEEVSE
jgi:competence ComEA-like helix-hairpin-helix protein